MPNHVEGRVVVVTGAAGGFGRLVAQKTAARGARVVAADVDAKGLGETTASIEDARGTAEGLVTDVTDLVAMRALASRAVDRFGALDVMVNNAGIMPLAFFADHEQAAEAWDRCIDVNLKGVLHGIMVAWDPMIQQGRGHVVNVSSIYGNHPVAGAAVYGATKAAVCFLSDALRQESQGRIKVTTIKPSGVPGTGLGAGVINGEALVGALGTKMGEYIEKMTAVLGEHPPEHLASPESIGYACLSPEILADQIVYAIDQPWGVSIGDLTVRASGDDFLV
ncbi:MAG: SDR family NAD(P)-dependent oxidoreductase [Deltaproteobacteria bacterium]|jgi:NADP-dependent 3-hydroxy acid dehydrogenase YdfG|nr:SDR family NAD(P)-dependent oxidoreductase [Deltaproteobacteria bacterium]MBW2496808.1 SDR family NAD(P)-dependent oxidoreductase [Deltaproteobacteria bacterium]